MKEASYSLLYTHAPQFGSLLALQIIFWYPW